MPVVGSVGVSGSALGVTAPLCPQEQAQGLWDQGCIHWRDALRDPGGILPENSITL